MKNKCKINRVTIKGWVNLDNNTVPQVNDIKNRYPDYKVKPLLTPEDYKNSDKVYIYGWYWRGEWSDPTKRRVETLYRPKNKIP